MPVTYKPTQGPAIAAKAGAAQGMAEKAKIQQQMNWQLAAEERAKIWELTKLELENHRQFANWQRIKQADDEVFLRGKEWEIEKAELVSKLDFQRNEEERQRALSELDVQEKNLNENKYKLPANQFDQLSFEIQRQRISLATGYAAGHYQPPRPEKLMSIEDQIKARILEILNDKQGGQSGTPVLPNPPIPTIPPGEVAMVSPTGIRGTALVEEVAAYQNQGYTLMPGQISAPKKTFDPFIEDVKKTFSPSRRWAIKVKSPEGTIEEIDSRDLSKYKEKGYKYVSQMIKF